MKNICNQIHFTVYKKRMGLADEAENKVSDKVRLEVYKMRIGQGDEAWDKVRDNVRDKVRQNLKL